MSNFALLADVANIFNGKTPAKSDQRDSGYPVLKIKDVSENGRFKGKFESFVDEEFANRHSSKKIKAHDTLILNAAHNADYVGSKQYRAQSGVEGSIATGEWLIVRANADSLDSGFLHYWITSPRSRFMMKLLVKGIHLYPKDVQRLKIPLPPLKEQKRIAAILDKADAIRRKRQQAIELADQFLRSVFLDMFGDPVTNPKGWDLQLLESLVSKLGDGLHGTPTYSEDGRFHFINGNNLDNGKIVFKVGGKRIGLEEYEKHKKDLNENTMLVSINGTIGKVAFYSNEQVVLGKSACYFNLLPDLVNKIYLFHLIRSPFFLHYVEGVVTSSTIKNVSLKSMRELPIPMPPMQLQQQFEKAILHIQRLLEKMSRSEESLEHNFSSLTQKVFKAA